MSEVCGFSSVVRALPCQGRGRELESLNPHHVVLIAAVTRNYSEIISNPSFRVVVYTTIVYEKPNCSKSKNFIQR